MIHSFMGAARRVLTTTACVLVATAGVSSAQVSTDIIRGRITDADAHAVPGADVTATSYAGRVTKSAKTDKNGRFTIVFINGEGDYWIDVRKLGLQPRRFELKKLGDEEVMIADARLSSAVVELDAMNVVGQRSRALPGRSGKEPDVGGGEVPLTNAGVSPDQAGNLAAMAAAAGFQLVPGLGGAPDMYSVLGLSGDQNNVTFNGLGSGISALPPDVLATTSINPYPFDVSKGGFSGAQITIQTIPGSNYSRRSVTNANILPPLEAADRSAIAAGGKFTNVRVGGNAAGPIAVDQVFYNVAYNVGRQLHDPQSLDDARPAGLSAAGVAPDSARRLLAFLAQRGIPARTRNVPDSPIQDVAQGVANFDVMPSASGTGHSFTLGTAFDYRRTEPVERGSPLLAMPDHGDDSRFWGANASLVHTNYFWFGILTKTTLGFAAQASDAAPYQHAPEGIVRVASDLPGGGSAVRSLSFGGNPLSTSASGNAVQATNQLSWFSLDNRHTIRLTSSIARDGFANASAQGAWGSFAFNSLADLSAGTPASYARTLSTAKQSGAQLVGAVAIGDYWRPAPDVQLQYGLRLDGNRFLQTPASNPAVLSTFGVENDVLPSRAYLSPRVGLQWAYGQSPQVAYAPGAARPPRAVIHLGAGVFQNVSAASLAAPALRATGLTSSTQSIACVGSAVPSPDWQAFLDDPSSIPTSCADGSTGTIFGSHAPSVTLFDPGFREPRSLRAAADWSGPVIDDRFVLGIQGIVSNGLDQVGAVDLNVPRTPRFALADEGNRPVYVSPAAIVPASGAIAASADRVSNAFQDVMMERSDLRIRSRAFSVNVKPVTANAMLKWDLTYTFLDVREQYYGFSSTAGDPFAVQWSVQPQTPRHSVDLRWLDVPIFDLVYLTTALHAASGPRFTPMIASDVNGDGAIDDRAYVSNPADPTNPNGPALEALLSGGSSSARACLAKQIGRLAARGSCQAPWTVANAIQLKLNPQKVGLPKRATVTLTVLNPLGIADLALHGSSALRGWGQSIPPDENLLFVRGFDPVTRRYSYDVNQRFGSTRPTESTARTLPFLSLAVSVDVGVPRERQLLTQRLDAGRGRPGDRANEESMKNLGTSSIPNPMAMVLTQQSALQLTRKQADSLAMLSRVFSVFADSVWTPVAEYLADLPVGYSRGEAYARYVSARERTVDYLLTLVPLANDVLTRAQRRRLPAQISNYLDRRVLEFLRSSSAGDGRSIGR
jgi:hypothetical protein